MTKFTPLQISILLHHYVSPAPWPTPSPAYNESVKMLMDHDLLMVSHMRHISEVAYTTTKRGVAHINQLLNLQPPKQAWVDAAGKIIPT